MKAMPISKLDKVYIKQGRSLCYVRNSKKYQAWTLRYMPFTLRKALQREYSITQSLISCIYIRPHKRSGTKYICFYVDRGFV